MTRWVSNLGLALLYAFAFVSPWSQAGGTIGAPVILATALFVAIVDPKARRGVPRVLVLCLAAYVGIHTAATLASPFAPRWDRWLDEMWLKFLLVAIPVLLAGRRHHAARAVRVLIASAFFVGLYAIFQHFTGIDIWRDKPLYDTGAGYHSVGFFGHHLTYGGQVLLIFLTAVAWALGTRSRQRTAIALTVAGVLGLAMVFSHARSALLGAGVGLLGLALAVSGWRRWTVLGTLAAVAVAAVMTPGILDRFAVLLEPGAESTRRLLWQSGIEAISHRPVLGFGIGTFGEVMIAFGVPGNYDSMGHTHNDFIMHGVNAGLLGLAAALVLLAATVVLAWQWRHRHPWLPAAAIACQLGISAAGMFQVYQTDNEVEMALYFLLGAAACHRSPRPGIA